MYGTKHGNAQLGLNNEASRYWVLGIGDQLIISASLMMRRINILCDVFSESHRWRRVDNIVRVCVRARVVRACVFRREPVCEASMSLLESPTPRSLGLAAF